MNTIVGQRVKQARKNRNLTQEVLAEKVSLSTNYLSQVERGKSLPSMQKLIDIAAELQVSLDYLVGNDENNSDFAMDAATKELIEITLPLNQHAKEHLVKYAKLYIENLPK